MKSYYNSTRYRRAREELSSHFTAIHRDFQSMMMLPQQLDQSSTTILEYLDDPKEEEKHRGIFDQKWAWTTKDVSTPTTLENQMDPIISSSDNTSDESTGSYEPPGANSAAEKEADGGIIRLEDSTVANVLMYLRQKATHQSHLLCQTSSSGRLKKSVKTNGALRLLMENEEEEKQDTRNNHVIEKRILMLEVSTIERRLVERKESAMNRRILLRPNERQQLTLIQATVRHSPHCHALLLPHVILHELVQIAGSWNSSDVETLSSECKNVETTTTWMSRSSFESICRPFCLERVLSKSVTGSTDDKLMHHRAFLSRLNTYLLELYSAFAQSHGLPSQHHVIKSPTDWLWYHFRLIVSYYTKFHPTLELVQTFGPEIDLFRTLESNVQMYEHMIDYSSALICQSSRSLESTGREGIIDVDLFLKLGTLDPTIVNVLHRFLMYHHDGDCPTPSSTGFVETLVVERMDLTWSKLMILIELLCTTMIIDDHHDDHQSQELEATVEELWTWHWHLSHSSPAQVQENVEFFCYFLSSDKLKQPTGVVKHEQEDWSNNHELVQHWMSQLLVSGQDHKPRMLDGRRLCWSLARHLPKEDLVRSSMNNFEKHLDVT